MNTMKCSVSTLVCAFALSGCATLGLTGSDRYRYESAVLVDNPRVTGQVPAAVDAGGGGQRSSVHMQSASKDRVCFMIRTPNPDALNEMNLVAYDSAEDIDKAAEAKPLPAGERTLTLRTVATGSTVETYEDKETVTHKDSSGRVIATSDRPVTRTATVGYSDMEACYKAQGLKPSTRYLGLQIKQATLFGESNYVVAAWRFGNGGETAR